MLSISCQFSFHISFEYLIEFYGTLANTSFCVGNNEPIEFLPLATTLEDKGVLVVENIFVIAGKLKSQVFRSRCNNFCGN